MAEKVAALEAKTRDMSRDTDPETGQPTVRFSGVNLQVVDGTGDTDGAVNGRGNLIVGYNRLRPFPTNLRTGSHNLIVGDQQDYDSFGGLVAGFRNAIRNEYAAVSGGYENVAEGKWSSVSGGANNLAIGEFASVSGGGRNFAFGTASSISGGVENQADDFGSSVSGGNRRGTVRAYNWAAGKLYQEQ